MPQSVQIVPKYQHPHVETYINDYTTFTEETPTTAPISKRKFLAVFQSSKGIDNTLVKMDNLSNFYNTFGKSDYEKYGQPLMMPIAELTAGATVYCMRVTTAGATIANSVLSICYKTGDVEVDDGTGTGTTKTVPKFQIKFVAESITDESSTSSQKNLLAAARSLASDDVDGWKKVPLILFSMNGRGSYGNNYRWRIVNNKDYEKEYNIKMFSFQALTTSTSTGVVTTETSVGSVLTPTRYERSTYINDIMSDTDKGVLQMNIECIDYNIEEIYNEYVNFVNSLPEEDRGTIPPADQFDVFFGKIISKTELYENIYYDEESVALDNIVGTALAGGNDGASDQDSINKAFIDAFEGKLDPKILVPRRCPVDALFDANYPYEVKEALVELALYREDTILYLDATTEVYNASNIESIIEDYSKFNSNYISKDIQHYLVRDYTTRRRVPVTMTYFYAQKLAYHLDTYGIQKPFVKAYAQLSDHIRDSLEPCIEITDLDIKEQLYTNRFNYFEAIDENTFQRACQNTSQTNNSDLLEESNMRVLLYLKKNLEMDCINNLYDFSSATDRARFTATAMAKYGPMQGVSVQSLSIYFDQSEWEAERSILHCYCSVVFRGIHKRTIVEIDVNKRNYTD